jgi:hypothetical protein
MSGHPVGFFGDPDHAEMGLRSMGNVVFVLALLATEPRYDARVTGMSRDWCLARARDCLAYMTRAHVTGDLTCADGKPWGNHWQSAWWTAKMALGAKLLWQRLTENERNAIERVVVYEADRHLSRRAPGDILRNTRSEENAWDTEVLAAAIALFPDHARARLWRSKLIEFALNTLSAPQDALNPALIDGRPMRDQVYTANVHPDFTIENHGAYHTCYMACPLHSLAWGYWALSASGQQVPEAQFHHFRDVWDRMKPTFLTRRFAYPTGKDWPRYAYGMSFIMPALVVLQHRYADNAARAIESRRFQTLEEEQVYNADGSFYGRRFTHNVMVDRMAEYETDTYANLGVCYLLHRQYGQPPRTMTTSDLNAALADGHVSPHAGFAFVRSANAFASLAWRRLDGPFPCAFFIPSDADDLAEWGIGNLLGRIVVDGSDPSKSVSRHRETIRDGVLDAAGEVNYVARTDAPLYTHRIAFRADCKRGIARVSYDFVADADIEVKVREGLRLHVANDFFNRFRRRWIHEGGTYLETFTPRDAPPSRETLTEVPLQGPCVNVDQRMGVVDLTARQKFSLRVSDRANGPWGSIHYSVLDCPPQETQTRTYHAGETILSGRLLIVLGDMRKTRTEAAAAVRSSAVTAPMKGDAAHVR